MRHRLPTLVALSAALLSLCTPAAEAENIPLKIDSSTHRIVLTSVVNVPSSFSFDWESGSSLTVQSGGTVTFATGSTLSLFGTSVTGRTGTGSLALDTSPTLTTPTISGATLTGSMSVTGDMVFDGSHVIQSAILTSCTANAMGLGAGSFAMLLRAGDACTANRFLDFYLGDANRSITLGGDVDFGTGINLSSLAGITLTGNGGKVVRVKSDTTGFELFTASGTGTVTSVDASASGGITVSGAPITTTGTLALGIDKTLITGLTEDTTPSAANDYIATYDASADSLKKVKIANLPTGDVSAAGDNSFTGQNTITTGGTSFPLTVIGGNGVTDGSSTTTFFGPSSVQLGAVDLTGGSATSTGTCTVGGSTLTLSVATPPSSFGGSLTIQDDLIQMSGRSALAVEYRSQATATETRYFEPSGSGSNYTGIAAQAQASDIHLVWPPTIGVTGDYLTGTVSGGIKTLNWGTFGTGVATALGNAVNTPSGVITGAAIGSGLSLSGGTLSATASGGSKTIAVFNPLSDQPPASSYATINTRNSIAVLEFADGSTTSAVFNSVCPDGATLTSGLTVTVHWMASTATTGNVVWQVEVEKMGTDLDADSFDTAATATGSANGTSGIITSTAITTTTIDSITVGSPYRVRISRVGANGSDTMTDVAQVIDVEIKTAN